jgi:hypothetical protein
MSTGFEESHTPVNSKPLNSFGGLTKSSGIEESWRFADTGEQGKSEQFKTSTGFEKSHTPMNSRLFESFAVLTKSSGIEESAGFENTGAQGRSEQFETSTGFEESHTPMNSWPLNSFAVLTKSSGIEDSGGFEDTRGQGKSEQFETSTGSEKSRTPMNSQHFGISAEVAQSAELPDSFEAMDSGAMRVSGVLEGSAHPGSRVIAHSYAHDATEIRKHSVTSTESNAVLESALTYSARFVASYPLAQSECPNVSASEDSGEGLSGGAIGGIVAGSVVGLAGAITGWALIVGHGGAGFKLPAWPKPSTRQEPDHAAGPEPSVADPGVL